MDRERLLDLREETEDKLKSLELGRHPKAPELDDRFDAANQRLESILIGDISEWVGRFYRRRYQRRINGEREEPLCKCQNPRCVLKRGELPYGLRRRGSAIRDSHPEAVVIDEALERQEELATEVSREFRDIQRGINQAVDDVVNDNVETVSIL